MYREKVITLLKHPKAQSFLSTLRKIFKDLPHIPPKAIDILAKIIPWLALLGVIVSVLAGAQHILTGLGLRRIEILPGPDIYWVIIGVLELVAAYIGALSFPLLRQRNHLGWQLLFWSTVLSTIMSLIAFVFGLTNIFGLLIATALSFYITFEVEPAYKPAKKTERKS